MNYSEFRSALYGDRHTEAFEIMNSLDHPDEKEIAEKLWWQMVKPELVTPDLVWSGKECLWPSLWYIDENNWTLSLGGIVIATNKTLDLNPIQVKWAIVPARHVLPIWENWAKDNDPERLNCVRELLDLLDQNASPDKIKIAREIVEVARDTTRSADSAAYWATRSAYSAAIAAATWATRSARSTVWNARDAAWAAASTGSLYDSEYKRWCLEWTKHVFTLIKETK